MIFSLVYWSQPHTVVDKPLTYAGHVRLFGGWCHVLGLLQNKSILYMVCSCGVRFLLLLEQTENALYLYHIFLILLLFFFFFLKISFLISSFLPHFVLPAKDFHWWHMISKLSSPIFFFYWRGFFIEGVQQTTSQNLFYHHSRHTNHLMNGPIWLKHSNEPPLMFPRTITIYV